MYANYLIDVGKLVFIVGDTQSTTQFRNLFQSSGSPKQKIFYKCMQQLPTDTFKKEKKPDQTKGIIRKEWFTKILNKNPQMIVMTFNCSAELAENQVWEDRLKVMIKRINKVYDAMKSNGKEEVRLKIVVLISKHTFGGVNLHQKITNFLKSYQKQLNIIQLQYYAKEITKIRSQWIYSLQKNYENKYKKIQKRWEESFSQRKLGAMVKMAILSEMISKKEEKNKYLETYTFLKKRFQEVIRTVTILNHNQIRQIRAVADIVFLRFLKSLIITNTSAQLLFRQTTQHMNYFKLKNLGVNETNKYFYYEQLLWRCTFIQNFLQILYKNDLMENISTLSMCELLNQLITYLHALAIVGERVVEEERGLGARLVEERVERYVGLVSYRGEDVGETDIVFTFISDIIHHKRDYLTKAIQLITRYKTMNIFKQNQLLFLNVYLLRLYFQDNKFQSFLTTYDEIMRQQISRSNYFLLNQIFHEIQDQFKSIGEEQKVMFYGMSCLICDYFESDQELGDRLGHLLVALKRHQEEEEQKGGEHLSLSSNNQTAAKSQQSIRTSSPEYQNLEDPLKLKRSQSSQLNNQQYRFSLKKKSNIASVSCYIENEFVYIQDEITLKFQIRLNEVIVKNGCKISFIFNHKTANSQVPIPIYSFNQITIEAGSESTFQKLLSIRPLQHFTKDESLKIDQITITLPFTSNLTFTIPSNHINFTKFHSNKIFTMIKCPQIQILNPFNVFYINEVSRFCINVERLEGFSVDAKFSIKEEDVYGKTEVFADLEDRINLTNSNYYQELVTKDKTMNQFWLKCNKIGQKTLKFTFHFTVEKIIHPKTSTDLLLHEPSPSTHPHQTLRQSFNVTKQIKFTIQQLFHFRKLFYQFSNDDARVLQNRNIPVGKKIVCVVEITATENVMVKEIGQHKNPKKVQYLKEIGKREIVVGRDNKVKLNMVFVLGAECKDEIELFLMSIYIKWSRLPSLSSNSLQSTPFQNLFLDHQTKINCYTNPLSIYLTTTQNFLFKKNQPNKLIFRVKNHSDFKNHVVMVVEGSANMLRIGERGKQVFVQPCGQNLVEFDVLPVVSGFLAIPQVRMFVDGVERNVNIKSGQVVKCL